MTIQLLSCFTLFVNAFRSNLVSGRQIWVTIFAIAIQVMAKASFWVAAHTIHGTMIGATLEAMISYSMIAGVILVAWSYSDLIRIIGDSVSTGDITMQLLKPTPYIIYLLSTQFGVFTARTLTVAVPVITISFFDSRAALPIGLIDWIVFFAAILLSFLILFLMAAICGLLSFWLMTWYSLDWFLQGVLALFSGSFLPLWLLPQGIKRVVLNLPFAWISYYPSALFIGYESRAEAVGILLGGMVWALFLFGLVVVIWRCAVSRLVVQGG